MKDVWVIGAGQLGRMMQYAGTPLGINVHPVNVDDPALAAPELSATGVITAERELWPETPSGKALQAHPNFRNNTVFGRTADRKTQKELIDALGVATAKWLNVEADTTAAQCYEQLGDTVLLKRRSGGYDGRGQLWLKQADGDSLPSEWQQTSIAEEKCPFDEEVSLVGARTARGELVFYPLTRNLHVNGILMASISPLQRLAHLQSQAEDMLGAILNELEYVGVMAMECFRIGDKLIVNELAPRVHNSGHWTQAGASISQFEMHLRAITELPLPSPIVRNHSVMINLIGVAYDEAWLAYADTQLHWYNKEVRPGRKVGHININDASVDSLLASLENLRGHLADNYGEVLDWVCEELRSLR
ncbi:5-(carboxyamino)imidazole ribonucleotide synthase [Halioglobus sp. HI00S01]|uniref:5-(carboxyamino)imidazole ribonucleotide synthase n=1 Tax=Halioglobus sp. HI00S01 TaxID=1822214 RepID=UPI0007C3BBE0|nr:5-(carboxyamino)imidazole ribonucleotide synthase [Halioglobus sp. HI00S01]KZX58742.1 5-(carboxyamino)imidazole ribonucleotide synthase [Halioglobus sp. HI00S01]